MSGESSRATPQPEARDEHRLQAISRALRIFSEATGDYRELLRAIVTQTALILRDSASLRIVSPDGQRLESVAAYDRDPEALERIEAAAHAESIHVDDPYITSTVLRTGEAQLFEKFDAEGMSRVTKPQFSRLIKELTITSALVIPLRIRDRVLGVMTLFRRGEQSPPLSKLDLELAQSLADQAALAVDNARLIQEARLQSAQRVLAARGRFYAERAQTYTQNIVDTVRHPLLVLDTNLVVCSVNPAFQAAFGGEGRDAEGKVLFELQDGRWDIPRLRSLLHEALSEHSELLDCEVEHELQTLGTKVLLFSARRMLRPSTENEQDSVAILLAIEDVTERRRAERALSERNLQLEAVNRELDNFSDSVSHDLRTPLRAINGFLKILVEDHGSRLDDEGLRIASVIEKNSQRMSELIDSLLSFSRLGRHPLAKTPIDVTQLVKAAAEELRALEPERKIELRIGSLPHALADRTLLKQVFMNLLQNAFKYTRLRAEPVVEVSGVERDDDICYTVSDDGVGFDMQQAAKLFGVFQRLHPSSDFEGTGIGLATVERLVKKHGGSVWAESEVDRGARFHFTLPRKNLKAST